MVLDVQLIFFGELIVSSFSIRENYNAPHSDSETGDTCNGFIKAVPMSKIRSDKERLSHMSLPTTYRDFFEFCKNIGLKSHAVIAEFFLVNEQTINNWKKRAKDGTGDISQTLPGWVPYSCYAITRLGSDIQVHCSHYMTGFPNMSIDWFKEWQNRHTLTTYQSTGDVFGVSRQAVHNWFCRNRFPKWISLSCIGYDLLYNDTP